MREGSSLTPEEVASILKIAKNTVYELIKRGELTAYRVGRKIRVDLQDVETYKKKGKRAETAQNAPAAAEIPMQPIETPLDSDTVSPSQGLVICGQDVLQIGRAHV